ncbi:MAG: hypothetical protein K2O64_03145 [Lactobacillus sp.]|nr:hypothetical protein [Lactobacillus sp.]
MVSSVVKMWDARYKIAHQELLYLYFCLLILLGCGTAFIVTLFEEFYLKSLVTITVVYLFSGNNLQVGLKLSEQIPDIFKQNYHTYFKYRWLIHLALNPLLVAYGTFIFTYSGWSFFSSKPAFSLEIYLIALALFLLLFAFTATLERYLLKLGAYLLLIGAIYLRELEHSNLANMFFLVVLFVALYLIFDRAELAQKRSRLFETRYLNLNYLAGALRYELVTKLFETAVLGLYGWLALKFKFAFSIIPLVVTFVLFENLVYLQMIFLKSKHFKARAFFLQGSQKLGARSVYGNLFYRDLYYFLIFVSVVGCSLHYGFFNLVQFLLATVYLSLALLYFTYLERVVSVTREKRPNFYEEYLGLVLLVLLVIVK